MRTKRYSLLITGLNSVTGWHLYQAARKSHQVVGTYRKRHHKLMGEALYRIDWDNKTEALQFVEKIQPDYIIHARAICDLDVCEETPWLAERINVLGTSIMVQAAHQVKCLRKLVYMSTDHVFGGGKGGYTEEDIPRPKHVFGRTKRQAEKIIQNSKLPYMIVRPGLVLGDSFQGNIGPQDFLLSRLRAGKPTTLFTDEWRSPISATEMASRVLKLTLSSFEGMVHVASTRTVNRYALGQELALKHRLPRKHIIPRLRTEDTLASIRPRDLSLISLNQ